MTMENINSNPGDNNDVNYSFSEHQVRIFIHQLIVHIKI